MSSATSRPPLVLVSTPSVPPLEAGTSKASVRAWAAAHGLTAWLRVLVGTIVRGASWDLLHIDLEALITRRPDRHVAPVQKVAIGFLEQQAVIAAEVRVERAARVAVPAPAEAVPAVQRLRALAARIEKTAIPRSSSALQLRSALDPLDLVLHVIEAGHPLCQGFRHANTTLVPLVPSKGMPAVQCGCVDPVGSGCPVALAAVEHAIDILTDPAQSAHAEAVALLGAPDWKRTLSRLDRLIVAPSAVASAPEDGARLGWRLNLADRDTIEPALCRPTKAGGWKTAGLSASELPPLDAPWLLPADRACLELMRGRQDGVGPLLSRLVGHPRVFLGRKGNHQLTVRRLPLALRLERSGAGVRLGPALDGVAVATAVLLEQIVEWDEGLVVGVDAAASLCWLASASEAAAPVLQTLASRGEIFPLEAMPDLLDRASTLDPLLPLEVERAIGGEPVSADQRPLLRLEALLDGGLVVRVRLRPLPEGDPVVPGAGARQIRAVRDGKRVYVERELDAEAARVRALLPPIRGDEAEPFGWAIAERDAALEWLAAVRELGERVTTEWSGPPRKVTRAAKESDLSVRVNPMASWLSVDGTLEVDGVRVPLAQLLEAIRDRQRYVRVDGDTWVRVADSLADALEGTAAVATERKGSAVVSPLYAGAVEQLEDAGIEVDGPAAWRDLLARIHSADAVDVSPPAGLNATLREYQQEGQGWLARLAAWSPGAVLADDMGLGKTLQAIALLLRRSASGPALVVAPTSLGFNWIRECERFAPSLRVRSHRGAARREALSDLGPGDVLIASYDVVVRDVDALTAIRFATLVLDEAQAVKNPETRRSRAVRALDVEFRVALTGTPLENRLADLWSLFAAVAPGLLGGWEDFRARFAIPIEAWGDAGRKAALSRLIRPFLLRRTKRQVAPELPARTEVTVPVHLSRDERRRYEELRTAAAAELAGLTDTPPQQRRFRVLAALTRLRQIACDPRLVDPTIRTPSSKLLALRDLVAELRSDGHRALVFSQFTGYLDLAQRLLEGEGVRVRRLDGSTPEVKRREEVDAFQAGEGDVFLISLKAGGTGLNLTAATYVIHLDPWWNPAVEDQATDRAHRIGQTRPVTVCRLVATGTVEERILDLHGQKRELVASVLDGAGEVGPLSTEDLLALVTEAADELDDDAPLAPAAPSLPPTAPPIAALPDRARVEVPPAPAPVASKQVQARQASRTSGPGTWLADFERWLEEGHGRPLAPGSVRVYAGAARRLAAWSAWSEAPRPTELQPAIDRYVAEVRAGRLGPASDRTLMTTVGGRLSVWLESAT